jgi:hypothetical protein
MKWSDRLVLIAVALGAIAVLVLLQSIVPL